MKGLVMNIDKEYRRRKKNYLAKRIAETKEQGEAAFKQQYALNEELMLSLDPETYSKVRDYARARLEYRTCLDRWYHDSKEFEALQAEERTSFLKKVLRFLRK